MFQAERACEALDRVDGLLVRIAAVGLEHASRATAGEIEEVARTAHHGRLVRVERELQALSTLLDRYLGRDPSFRPEAWVSGCSRAWLLAVAARRAIRDGAPAARLDEVLGVPRRRYEPVPGALLVHALAATGFVTESGFTGITIHLWDPAGQRIVQATTVRPIDLVGDDPSRLLFQPISEVTPIAVHELAHGAWALDDVRLSADARLSLHGGLQVIPAPPMGRRAYDAIAVDGAAALLDRLAATELDPIGVGGAVLAYLEPSAIRAVAVDETHARVTAEVVDRAGAVLRVVLPLRRERDVLVDNLERLAAREAPAALVGRGTLAGGELLFEPYTAVFEVPVKLAFKRAGVVQEVHLSLEPLTGEAVRTAAPAPARRAERKLPDPLVWLLDDVWGALRQVWSSGLALPDPELPDGLFALAERARAGGANEGAERIAALAAAIAGVRAGEADPSVAHRAAQALAAWARLFRTGLGLELVRSRLVPSARVAARPRGEDAVLSPVGVEVDRHRVSIHAVDAGDGGWVVLHDELPGLDSDRPLDVEAPSRLFQAKVRLRDRLGCAVVLRDHPIARAGGRRVVRPAFHAAAESGDPIEQVPVPLVEAPSRSGPFRLRVVARRGPDGWRLFGTRGELDAVLGDEVVLDLEKRSVDDALTFEVVAVAPGDRVRLLAVDGTYAPVDPAATRWPLARLVERAAGSAAEAWVAALAGAPLPADPGAGVGVPDEPRAVVEGIRRRVAAGEVMPPAAVLWALGTAIGATERPIRALGLPAARLRLAAVAPLARWLRGDAPVDAAVVDAIVLLLGSGEDDTVVSRV